MTSDISERLREEVGNRAKHRCEYCLISEADSGFRLQIDHVVSRKHGGTTSVDNLALSCIICNRYKGTDVASIHVITGELASLFNPRRDRWADHFQIRGERIEGLTPTGSVTSRLLRMNAPERLLERRLLQVLGAYPKS